MLIMVGVLAIGPISVVTTNIYGTPETVTVSFYKKIHKAKSNPFTVSCGYYYVKGKRYTAVICEKLPIGAKFQIKRSPIVSCEYNTIGALQE